MEIAVAMNWNKLRYYEKRQWCISILSSSVVGCRLYHSFKSTKVGTFDVFVFAHIAHIEKRKNVSALMLCMPSRSCHIKTKNKNKSTEKWECIGINRLFCSIFRIDATHIGTENVLYLSYKQNVQKVNSLTLLCMSPLRLRIFPFEFNS